MSKTLKYVGLRLYGYCDGYFDNESYDNDKFIEACGNDWVIAHGIDDNHVYFAKFENSQELIKKVKEWSQENE